MPKRPLLALAEDIRTHNGSIEVLTNEVERARHDTSGVVMLSSPPSSYQGQSLKPLMASVLLHLPCKLG